jgi:uncharacterized protein YodC (DUF2158 family)
MAESLKVGDVVKLKSGGQAMVIDRIDTRGARVSAPGRTGR